MGTRRTASPLDVNGAGSQLNPGAERRSTRSLVGPIGAAVGDAMSNRQVDVPVVALRSGGAPAGGRGRADAECLGRRRTHAVNERAARGTVGEMPGGPIDPMHATPARSAPRASAVRFGVAVVVGATALRCSSETPPPSPVAPAAGGSAAVSAGSGGSAGAAGRAGKGGTSGGAQGVGGSAASSGGGSPSCTNICSADYPCQYVPASAFCVGPTSYVGARTLPCSDICPKGCPCSGGGCIPETTVFECPKGQVCVSTFKYFQSYVGGCAPGIPGEAPCFAGPQADPCLACEGTFCSDGDKTEVPLCTWGADAYSRQCSCVGGKVSCKRGIPTANSTTTAPAAQSVCPKSATESIETGDACTVPEKCTFASSEVACACGVLGRAYATCACTPPSWSCTTTADDCAVRCASGGADAGP